MTKRHDRRRFLQSTLAGTSLCLTDLLLKPLTGISNLAFAQTTSHGVNALHQGPLIVVFQRGAADGLNILSPLDDENFLAARPPDMRFNRDQASGKIDLDNTKLYWHNEAQPLAHLFENRMLALWPAVGIANETRSHFEAQEIIERGVHSLTNLPDNLGWFARQMLTEGGNPPLGIPVFAGSTIMPRAMQGISQAVAIRDLQSGISLPHGEAGMDVFSALCSADSKQIEEAAVMRGHIENIAKINQVLPKLSDNKIAPYQTAGKTDYPNNDPGIGLRSVARFINARLGLQYAWVDQTGWDTHDSQPSRMNGVIKNLSQALEAFTQDMQARSEPFTLIVLTEFGRRLRSNRSNGTDHGHASLAIVIGNQIPGGQVLGKWPGLHNDALDRGVDLAVTTEYQRVITQAQKWRT